MGVVRDKEGVNGVVRQHTRYRHDDDYRLKVVLSNGKDVTRLPMYPTNPYKLSQPHRLVLGTSTAQAQLRRATQRSLQRMADSMTTSKASVTESLHGI